MTAAFETAETPWLQTPRSEKCAHPRRPRGRTPRTPEAGPDWDAILEALVAGDREALAQVSRVITAALCRTRTFDLQPLWEDVHQEVLAALLRSASQGTLRPRSFVAYCATITRNALSRRLVRIQRSRTTESDAEVEGLPQPDRGGADPGMRIDLERALCALPERQRRVIEAVYLEGRSYVEASAHLGVALGTLKRLQTQGLRELREQMGLPC